MIPDKIYTFQDDGDRYWYKPEEWETPPLTRVEYIRKDALLEFLKKKVNEIEIAMETGADDPVLWGQRNAFKQVIDKINSM